MLRPLLRCSVCMLWFSSQNHSLCFWILFAHCSRRSVFLARTSVCAASIAGGFEYSQRKIGLCTVKSSSCGTFSNCQAERSQGFHYTGEEGKKNTKKVEQTNDWKTDKNRDTKTWASIYCTLYIYAIVYVWIWRIWKYMLTNLYRVFYVMWNTWSRCSLFSLAVLAFVFSCFALLFNKKRQQQHIRRTSLTSLTAFFLPLFPLFFFFFGLFTLEMLDSGQKREVELNCCVSFLLSKA